MNTSQAPNLDHAAQELAGSRIVPVKREKKAKRSVLIADKIADKVITIGGVLVIIAVLGILVFLVGETLPLFRGGVITNKHDYLFEQAPDSVLSMTMDEYKTFILEFTKKGEVMLFHAKTGKQLTPPELDFHGTAITSFSDTLDRRNMAFGFADGTIQFVTVLFETETITADDLPQGLTKLDERDATNGSTIYSRIPGNKYRKISLELESEPSLLISKSGNPIVALDYRVSGEAERQTKAFVTIDGEDQVTLNVAATKINLLTGDKRTSVKQIELPPFPDDVSLHSVILTEKADAVILADKRGILYRYNTSDLSAPVLAEKNRVMPRGTRLTVFDFLLGGQSIVVGGSDGSLAIYFLVDDKEANTSDGQLLVRAREFESLDAAAVLFDASQRGKSFAIADERGNLKVMHGTSQKTLMSFSRDSKTSAYQVILLAPRMDGVVGLQTDGRVRFWEFSVPHPETTFRTLFQKVWYEGYRGPTYTWQSSAATGDYESKFSLVPLIFGTIKAAFYSLLFAIPVAILAAIFTSEFVNYRVRGFVKPTMEMMASLPSVILGFVAALVLAPVVETWVAAIILAFVVFPLSLMLAAYLWQLIPLRLAMRLQGAARFSLMAVVVLISLFLSMKLGPLFESAFFQGDFRAWVNGDVGGPEPFLLLICLPISFLVITILITRFFGRRISNFTRGISRFRAAIFDMGRWLVTIILAVLCSYAAARLLSLVGLDVRGGFIDTYVQRNTLIVGFAMGFAVIPIIYTIAEDALNAVPEHLRAASLGCGATPWQTAINVVLPTAISGVFSAIMIGMGRAVGETMIVVMSAGNTPLLDWNIFNGLRALSATIAVELPEAVKDGTLYRILFLAGLVLFAMTFIINTVAEIVRLRFRKRAMQL